MLICSKIASSLSKRFFMGSLGVRFQLHSEKVLNGKSGVASKNELADNEANSGSASLLRKLTRQWRIHLTTSTAAHMQIFFSYIARIRTAIQFLLVPLLLAIKELSVQLSRSLFGLYGELQAEIESTVAPPSHVPRSDALWHSIDSLRRVAG